MRKLNEIILVIVLLLILFSCQQNNYKYKGEIIGNDLTQCMCCGGTFISIEGKTYRFYKLPNNSKLKLKQEKFPIKVKVDFNKDIEQCLGDEIIIEKIEIE